MNRVRFLPALLLLVPLLVYGPLLMGHGYVWDDWQLFVQNPALQRWDTLVQRALEPVLWGSAYLRPLPMASFGVELSLAGLNPFWAHLSNLLLHTLNCGLVFWLARSLVAARPSGDAVNDRLRAAVPALLYALHPSLVEPTAWISGRFDLMVTSFSLGALGLLVAAPKSLRRDLGVAACFAGALLSKEMAVTLPLLAALLLAWVSPEPWLPTLRARWRLGLLLVAVLVAYLAFRAAVLGQPLPRVETPNSGLELLPKLALIGTALLFYLRATWLPFFGHSPLHPINAHALEPVAVATGVGVLVAVAVLLGVLLVRRPRHALALGLGLWCVALLPVLHILPLPVRENLAHDRFLALPLAFWALTATQMHWRSRLRLLNLGVWLLACLLMVRSLAPRWTHDLTLWPWAFAQNPESQEVVEKYLESAFRYELEPVPPELVAAAERLYPGKFALSAADARLRRGDGAGALRILQAFEQQIGSPQAQDEAAPAAPNASRVYPILYVSKAGAYWELGDMARSARMAEIALRYQPDAPLAHLLLAFARYGQAQWPEGDAAFAEAQRHEGATGSSGFATTRRGVLQKLCARPDFAPHQAECRRRLGAS